MIVLTASVLLLAVSCRETTRALPAEQAAALEHVPASFPSESLAESGDCYTARMDYPFLGRPALDEILRAQAEGIFREAREELKSYCSSGKEEKDPLYEFTASYQVFSSHKVVSVLFNLYTYTGGAHGLNDLYALNLRLSGGKPLGWNDLFARPEGLWDFLADCARASLRPELEEYWLRNPDFAEGLRPEEASFKYFALTEKGLSLFFPPYQLAPYAAGQQRCDIPLEALLKFIPRPGLWD
jgi:hypothetical protein